MLPQPDNTKPKGVGRVSVVNEKMELIYDAFVHYGPEIEHRPDPQRLNLGVKYQDIMPENGAQLHEDVLEALKTMFDKSGGLVAHDFKSDRRMLKDMSFSLVVQLQHDCNLICNASSTTTMSITGAEFATCTRQVIAAVHPCSVELSVNFTFHPMSVFVSDSSTSAI
jgi:hypothetical protein